MLKKFIYDPSFWTLIAVNSYCIYYYKQHPEGFSTIVWLYWIQSVLIGLFNFADILTVRNIDPNSMTVNDKPINNSFGSKGCVAFFFLFHYQFFHFVYMIFLVGILKGKVDVLFVLMGTAALFAGLLLQFIRHKMNPSLARANVGSMFFLPYLRIIPMHLMILAPAFWGWSSATLFLVLKMLADVIMYILTSPYHKVSDPIQ